MRPVLGSILYSHTNSVSNGNPPPRRVMGVVVWDDPAGANKGVRAAAAGSTRNFNNNVTLILDGFNAGLHRILVSFRP